MSFLDQPQNFKFPHFAVEKELGNLVRYSTIYGFVILIFCVSALAQRKTDIKIAAESIVENEIITLKDIAKISPGGKSEILQSITLGYSPNVGMTREILRERILLAIASAGISKTEFTLNSRQKVLVKRAGQQINAELLRNAIEKIISDHFSASPIAARIVRLDLPQKLEAPVGTIEVRTGMANVSNLFAPFSLPIEIRINDKIFRRFSVNIEIEAFSDILIAARDIATNKKLSTEDIRLENRRLEKPLVKYLFDPANLRGVMLIKNLRTGEELTLDSFVSAVVIKSGDLVKIIGQSGKMQIIVNGEARTNGKIGDRIAVRNSESKAMIQATVIEEGIVKIIF